MLAFLYLVECMTFSKKHCCNTEKSNKWVNRSSWVVWCKNDISISCLSSWSAYSFSLSSSHSWLQYNGEVTRIMNVNVKVKTNVHFNLRDIPKSSETQRCSFLIQSWNGVLSESLKPQIFTGSQNPFSKWKLNYLWNNFRIFAENAILEICLVAQLFFRMSNTL